MATLTGRVIDAAGRPVAGAAVFVVAAPAAMPDIARLTDADGGFDVEAPVPGTYTIAAAAPAGEGRVTVEVGLGAPPPVALRLRGGVDR